MERVTGIEPAWPAWKAGALPLSYTRVRVEMTEWGGLVKMLWHRGTHDECNLTKQIRHYSGAGRNPSPSLVLVALAGVGYRLAPV